MISPEQLIDDGFSGSSTWTYAGHGGPESGREARPEDGDSENTLVEKAIKIKHCYIH